MASLWPRYDPQRGSGFRGASQRFWEAFWWEEMRIKGRSLLPPQDLLNCQNLHQICISTTSFHLLFSSLTFAMFSRRVFTKVSTRVKKTTYRATTTRQISLSSTSLVRDNQFQSTLMFFFIAFIFFETTLSFNQMNHLMIEVEIEKTTQLTTKKKTKHIAQLKKRFRVLKRNRLSIKDVDNNLNENRRFFLNNDNELVFLSLIKMFSIVNRKHFQDIWRKTFLLENFNKLFNDYFAKDVIIVDDDDVLVVDLKSLAHLIRCFEVYCQIIIEFAHVVTRSKLQKVLIMYRIQLITLVINHIFESLLFFHKTFVYARICESQNDLEIWKLIDKQLENTHLMRRIKKSFLKSKTSLYSSTTNKNRFSRQFVLIDYCRRFNNDLKCKECAYKHVYDIC